MTSINFYTFFFIFLLSLTAPKHTNAQSPIDSAAAKIAAIEERSFSNLPGTTNRLYGDQIYPGTVASANFDVNFYRCEWEIDPAVRFIKGKVTSYFTITSASAGITYDLSDTLTVDSIIYHGSPILFQRITNDGLQIQFPVALNAGQQDSVAVYYNGVPNIKKSYQAFSQYMHNGTPVISTVSEPYGAKEWWPCKNGLTDKADSIDIIITSPPAYKGVCNGVLLSDETTGGKRSLHYKHRYPIASYLLGIAVTNYETATDSVQIGGKTIPLICHYYPENIYDLQAANYYAKISIQKFSQLFGDYPFINEQYSQTQWSTGGGMEHQTNSFIRSADRQLIAHELGHQWFGDKVTCGSWQHIWLHEGFADYMQYIFVENFDSTIKLIHLQAHMGLALSDSAGSVFVTDTTNPSTVFNSTHSYYKGGYVVHMLRWLLGDSVFFSGLKKYLADPSIKYGFATTANLQKNLEQASGKNLQSFFTKWIYGQGYPNYNSVWYQNTNNWAHVTIEQTTTHPSVSFYEMPVQLRFKNNTRDTLITVNHSFSGQAFWVNPGFKADSMFIDPYLWLLAKDRKVKKTDAAVTAPNDLQFFPNPAPQVLNVYLRNPALEKITVVLYNANGQLLRQSDVMLQGRDELIPVPTSSLPHGVYIVKITSNKNILAIKKFVK